MTRSEINDAPSLDVKWLRSRCCEMLGDHPNPAFDSGVRARLRRALNDQTPANVKVCNPLNEIGLRDAPDSAYQAFRIAAGVFATCASDKLPAERKGSSFGWLCRALALAKQQKGNRSKVDPQNPFVARFERLLECRAPAKMIPYIRGISRLVRSHEGKPALAIDWQRFLKDLIDWEKTWRYEKGARFRWAVDFWREESSREETNDAE